MIIERDSYSLSDKVADGLLGPSPRWVLHLVKLAQHAGPAFALVALSAALHDRPDFFLGAFVGGLAMYCVILTHKRVKLGMHAQVNRLDWLFDASFPIAVTGAGALAEHLWVAGGAMLLVAVLLYTTLHTRGIP